MDKLKLTFRVHINNLNIIEQNILIFVQRYRSKIRTRDSGAGYLLPFSLRHFAYHGHGPNLLFTQGYDAMVLYYLYQKHSEYHFTYLGNKYNNSLHPF